MVSMVLKDCRGPSPGSSAAHGEGKERPGMRPGDRQALLVHGDGEKETDFGIPAPLRQVWEVGLSTRSAVTPAAGTRWRAATRGRPPRSPSGCASPVPRLLPFKIKRQRAATAASQPGLGFQVPVWA